jgi:hypothetical protein
MIQCCRCSLQLTHLSVYHEHSSTPDRDDERHRHALHEVRRHVTRPVSTSRVNRRRSRRSARSGLRAGAGSPNNHPATCGWSNCWNGSPWTRLRARTRSWDWARFPDYGRSWRRSPTHRTRAAGSSTSYWASTSCAWVTRTRPLSTTRRPTAKPHCSGTRCRARTPSKPCSNWAWPTCAGVSYGTAPSGTRSTPASSPSGAAACTSNARARKRRSGTSWRSWSRPRPTSPCTYGPSGYSTWRT